MEYTVYGMNVKGEIASLASDMDAHDAYNAWCMYQDAELAPMVFNRKALWVWVSQTGVYPHKILKLQMALQEAESLRRW